MPLIICKVELKIKWINHCVLYINGNGDDDASFNNIIFIIKDKKLYIPVVTLSEKDNKNLSKLLSKGFERSLSWNEFKRKSEMKSTIKEYRSFLKSNFVGVDRFFVVFYSNQDDNAKRFKARRF